MPLTRRGLLRTAAVGSAVAVASAGAGCLRDPGPRCPGATVRLSLAPTDDAADDPLDLDAGTLSAEADAVVETAVDGEHVEHCVSWDPAGDETGPSDGLREVGERLEDHAGVELARRTTVETDVERGGDAYRLVLTVDRDGDGE